jgi:hypothetical protein
MSAGTRIEQLSSADERRSRSVWAVLALCSLVFVALCAFVAVGLGTYINTLTVPRTATLEPRQDAQVVVKAYHSVTEELITGEKSLGEGDTVSTKEGSAAFLTLFDDSTVQLYFDTELVLNRMRTSRFFGTSSEIVLTVNRGTLVVATGGLDAYGVSQFLIATEGGGATVGPNSKVHIRVDGSESGSITSITLDEGTASLSSRGTSLVLKPKELGHITSAGVIDGPFPAEEELVRNGQLTDEATNGAELVENGGLGTAAWLPIRSQTVPPVSDLGVVEVVAETVGGQTTNAVRLQRGSGDTHFIQVGMRQEINRPAEYLTSIEVKATIKIVQQTLLAPGPRVDLFPLTIKVIYRDSSGKQHDWKHSFYYQGDTDDIPNATRVRQLGAWTSVEGLPLKSAETGQAIQMIEAIEVYGFGHGFEGWITGISLIAR